MTVPRALEWWFRDSSTGEIVLWQPPNASMVVAQAAAAAQALDLAPTRARELGWMRTGALVVWGLDELVRGTTPIRRVIGAITAGRQVVRLVRS